MGKRKRTFGKKKKEKEKKKTIGLLCGEDG